jgi:Zn-dependent protease with chaperone function
MKPGLKIPFLVLVCLIFAIGMLAQNTDMYSPLQDDPAIIQQLSEATRKQYRKDVDNLSGDYQQQLAQVYRERYRSIRRMYSNKEIIAEEKAAGYLQLLAKEIFDNNLPLQNLETRIVFSRSWWPNASNTGEGTIIFNIGLFNRLHNESQAAFIICHELAHLFLKHSDTSMVLGVKYRVLNYRHDREQELAADSLALEWLKNTSFDVREALSALLLLDNVDRDKYDNDPGLDQAFEFNGFPFEALWTKEQPLLRDTQMAINKLAERIDEDSLKTHPHCSVRIKHLEARVAQYYRSNSKAFVINEELFKKLKHDFDYEIIEYCFRTGNISRSLYHTLQMLPGKRSDAYLVTNTGRCLNEIHKAMKANTLSKIVDPVTASNDKKYNKLIRYIHQLRLSDVASISYFYLLVYQRELSAQEDFLEALITSKINFNKPEEKKYWTEQYQKQFPDGKYKF